MSDSVVIVDYGVGNLGSIVNMLKRLDMRALVSSRPQDILGADRLVLPGVGAFDSAMNRLRGLGLAAPIEARVGAGVPLLGICLGMQLFGRRSEEGDAVGFGWIDAQTIRFRFEDDRRLRVPHMGWNDVTFCGADRRLDDGALEHRYYFAHSYHLECRDPTVVIATTTYGYTFPSIIGRDNLVAVQFHPEKSHRYGLALLGAFIRGSGFERLQRDDLASSVADV